MLRTTAVVFQAQRRELKWLSAETNLSNGLRTLRRGKRTSVQVRSARRARQSAVQLPVRRLLALAQSELLAHPRLSASPAAVVLAEGAQS
ncbi:MAG: hypothetical protein C1943_07960 [Halochromatium sp.]|nr:hypothetical protein [Halochromatium sp.]